MPVLEDFKLYGARSLQAPRVPDEDAPDDPAADITWTQDYEQFGVVTGNTFETFTYVAPISEPPANRRYRWLLLVVTAMSADPYQMALNELEVTVAGDVYSSATYLATGTVYGAVAAILAGCGVPSGALIDGSGTPTVTGYTTAPDMAWQVCADLADMTGCFLSAGRDSKITIDTHPYFGGSPEIDTAWSKTLATSYAPDWPWGRMVSQVELPWLALDGGTGGTVKYPCDAGRVWGGVDPGSATVCGRRGGAGRSRKEILAGTVAVWGGHRGGRRSVSCASRNGT